MKSWVVYQTGYNVAASTDYINSVLFVSLKHRLYSEADAQSDQSGEPAGAGEERS